MLSIRIVSCTDGQATICSGSPETCLNSPLLVDYHLYSSLKLQKEAKLDKNSIPYRPTALILKQ